MDDGGVRFSVGAPSIVLQAEAGRCLHVDDCVPTERVERLVLFLAECSHEPPGFARVVMAFGLG